MIVRPKNKEGYKIAKGNFTTIKHPKIKNEGRLIFGFKLNKRKL